MLKKLALITALALLVFAGCGSGSMTPGDPGKKQFYGVYRDSLKFTASTAKEAAGVRVVITDNAGVKLLDLAVSKHIGAEYYYISRLPKNTIQEFEDFFHEYFFFGKSKNIKIVQGKIYYYDEKGSEILRMQEVK